MWRLSLFLCGTGAALQIRCLIKAESSQISAGRRTTGPKAVLERPNKPSCREARLCYIPPQFKVKKGPFMADESDYKPGSMDISAHKKAYAGFLTGSKWTFGFIMLIMIFLAFFRTHG
jgi:hypothetical protein